MTVQEYVRDYLPARLLPGASPGARRAAGVTAELVLLSERTGREAFAHENFTSAAERAMLITPYQVNDLKELTRVRLVAELIILYHRTYSEDHGEDHADRIQDILNTVTLTKEESDMIEKMMAEPRGFWN